MTALEDAALAVSEAIDVAARGLVDRRALVELIALAAVAEEHVLVVGPPGTAKSEAVRRVARVLGGRYFEYLLGRFTEPNEIFGPVDLRKLREGIVETQIDGMLPDAEVAFLDEVFLGSTAILNTLLAILNERSFRRGHTRIACPLRICVGATNMLPEDESLAAFADRFLARIFLESIPDPELEALLEGGWSLMQAAESKSASLADLDRLAAAAKRADLGSVRDDLAHAIRLLRSNGVAISDRRAVKMQRLVAAAAALAAREAPANADLWPIVFAVPTEAGQRVARDVLKDLLENAENRTLRAAAEEASLGPIARATRIAALGREVLSQRPGEEDRAARESWRLRLEGVAREIDAGFAPENLPANLKEIRGEIIRALGPM
jgi:MoxR-like ATPase